MVTALKHKTIQAHTPVFPGQNMWRNLRIGLLGGSFNPAHEAHLHISLEAIKRLNLDWVWWLVSPQNPLKDAKNLAPLTDRISAAKKLTKNHPAIHVSDVETHFGTNKTIDTLRTLKTACPENQFIWLMGADNMAQFDKWASWEEIVSLLPIGIIDRGGYSTKALQGKLAKRYAHLRVAPQKAKMLGVKQIAQSKSLKKIKMLKSNDKATTTKPKNGLGWTFLPCRQHPQSSTNIRNQTDLGSSRTTN